MATKPVKKPAKAPKLSGNMRKGKNISLTTSDFTITKHLDKSSA